MADKPVFLDFEKPIAELEKKIDELTITAEKSGAANVRAEISKLREKANRALSDLYINLDPWKRTQVARHPDRPHFTDYVATLITDYVEMAGDRKFGEDAAILGGIGRFRGRRVVVLGHEKGRTTPQRLKHNFGMGRPEGYRKAVRLMDLAERFGLSVLTFVDTAGAFPGPAMPLKGADVKRALSGGTLPGQDPQASQAYMNYVRRLQHGQSGFTCYASLQMPGR